MTEPKPFLISIFNAAVAAADPERTIRDHLPAKPRGRTIVIGAGKASAAMAKAVEDHWKYSQASTVSSGSIEMQRILLSRALLAGAK